MKWNRNQVLLVVCLDEEPGFRLGTFAELLKSRLSEACFNKIDKEHVIVWPMCLATEPGVRASALAGEILPINACRLHSVNLVICMDQHVAETAQKERLALGIPENAEILIANDSFGIVNPDGQCAQAYHRCRNGIELAITKFIDYLSRMDEEKKTG